MILGAGAAQPDPSIDGVDLGGGKEDSANPTGEPTRNPIILVHGFNASPMKNGFGPEVVRALCNDGHSVFAPALPPFASSEVRGAVLAGVIDLALAGGRDDCGNQPATLPTAVNIIAHSMGGLDSRFAISSLGYGDRVATLVTLSTPHGGSAIADQALGLISGVDRDALNGFAALLARTVDSPSTLEPDLRAAFESLAEANAPKFDAQNPDDTRVHYESWAGLSNVAGIINPQDIGACEHKLIGFASATARHKMHVVLKAIAAAVAHKFELRPNDGLVQVARAKHGTFRGCLPADHIDEVGALPATWSPFPHVKFARIRAFELAAAGY